MAHAIVFNGTQNIFPSIGSILRKTLSESLLIYPFLQPKDTCNPTYLNYSEVPSSYNTSRTPLCGISFPSSLLPQANFSGTLFHHSNEPASDRLCFC